MTRRVAGLAVVPLALLAACSGEKKKVPAADVASGYVDIGVPECDQFARKYLACIEHVPGATRDVVRQAFEQTREQWSLVAEKPDRRAGLAAACLQQEKATRAGMARYDCDW